MISIIIPTLNEESVLENTLSNLHKELTIPHEIIVSDGKSSDRTIEIARTHSDKVIVYDGAERQTIAQGRNDGAAAAHPESTFFVFIDADCRIFDANQFFTTLIDRFNTDPHLVAMNVAIRVLREYETLSDKIILSTFNWYIRCVNNVLNLGISAGEFQMVRADVFRRINGYNPTLVAAEDVDLFRRLTREGRVRTDPHLTIYHTGRRAHKTGWPKLLWLWTMNSISMTVRGRSLSKEWKPIR